ncbi:MAG: hypothetical protein Q8P59_05945 [Dehalococcoidia bacterium]|nr:hypothetical protein [Dehalococcoidia bacterium]
MPYKSSEEARGAAKERMRKMREKKHEGVTKGVTLEGVTGQGVTGLPLAWQAVVDYLKGAPGNLAKLQAISGSLGKYSGQVYFGGLSMQEVGEGGIGNGPPVGHEVFSAPLDRDHCGRLRGPLDLIDMTPLCKRTYEHMHQVPVHA